MSGARCVVKSAKLYIGNKTLRVYSHLPCLVQLNQTQVSFPHLVWIF